jgi:hypothetical protein
MEDYMFVEHWVSASGALVVAVLATIGVARLVNAPCRGPRHALAGQDVLVEEPGGPRIVWNMAPAQSLAHAARVIDWAHRCRSDKAGPLDWGYYRDNLRGSENSDGSSMAVIVVYFDGSVAVVHDRWLRQPPSPGWMRVLRSAWRRVARRGVRPAVEQRRGKAYFGPCTPEDDELARGEIGDDRVLLVGYEAGLGELARRLDRGDQGRKPRSARRGGPDYRWFSVPVVAGDDTPRCWLVAVTVRGARQVVWGYELVRGQESPWTPAPRLVRRVRRRHTEACREAWEAMFASEFESLRGKAV